MGGDSERGQWKRGNCAGQHFRKDGDIFHARHVVSPRGESQILCTVVGFRMVDGEQRRSIIDRYLIDPIATISDEQLDSRTEEIQ